MAVPHSVSIRFRQGAAPRQWPRLVVLGAFGALLISPAVWLGLRVRFDPDRAAVQQTANAFLSALERGDAAAARALLIPEAATSADVPPLPPHLRAAWSSLRWQFEGVTAAPTRVRYRLAARTTPFNPATIQVQSFDGQELHVGLRKVEGAWRVSAIWYQVSEDATFLSWDYAHLRQVLRTLPPPADPTLTWIDQLKPLDRSQVDAAWQITVDVQAQPARAVLQALPPGQPLTSTLVGFPEGALSRPITLKLRGVSKARAVDEIFRRLDLVPRYQSGIILPAPLGQPARPATHAGPFRIEVDRLTEFLPNPTGHLSLRVTASGLPPAVAALVRSHGGVGADVQVVAEDGRDLLHAEHRSYFPNVPTSVRGLPAADACEELVRLPLRNLLADVEEVSAVRGKVRLPVPTRVAQFRFQPLTVPGTRREGELTVELVGVTAGDVDPITGPQLSLVEIRTGGMDGRPFGWLGHDDQGRLVVRGCEPALRSGSLVVRVPASVTALTCKVVSELTIQEHAFELTHLPLKGRVPSRLERPHFPGQATPITVEALPGEPAVTLQVRNHSQKDIDTLHLKWAYQEREGGQAREVVIALPAEAIPNPGNRLPVLVPARAVRKIPVTAPGSPVKPDAIRILGVGFTDGTSWSP